MAPIARFNGDLHGTLFVPAPDVLPAHQLRVLTGWIAATVVKRIALHRRGNERRGRQHLARHA